MSDVVFLVRDVVLLNSAAAVDTKLPPVVILEAWTRVATNVTRGAQTHIVTQHVSGPVYLDFAKNGVWLNYSV